MGKETTLGIRMKEDYEKRFQTHLMRRTPTMLRLVTDEEVDDFNVAAEEFSEPLMKHEVIEFFKNHLNIYYRGKMWGFSDTEVRDEIYVIFRDSTLQSPASTGNQD